MHSGPVQSSSTDDVIGSQLMYTSIDNKRIAYIQYYLFTSILPMPPA